MIKITANRVNRIIRIYINVEFKKLNKLEHNGSLLNLNQIKIAHAIAYARQKTSSI